jgi:hypothetical protein
MTATFLRASRFASILGAALLFNAPAADAEQEIQFTPGVPYSDEAPKDPSCKSDAVTDRHIYFDNPDPTDDEIRGNIPNLTGPAGLALLLLGVIINAITLAILYRLGRIAVSTVRRDRRPSLGSPQHQPHPVASPSTAPRVLIPHQDR